ncbi:hypothetical protein Salat_0852100 [Sesamum alatum]|uniref:Uncharacterized protein n=1 Tax=Sesamum alatum TaxID=300844 RepID=A0AAE1YIV2_9LAMI|nr:hypothetical protein Salat_0852100 [Sesamum alatum]
MMDQEPLLGQALHSKDMQSAAADDEADETLSLCDLPLYSDQSVEEWEGDLSSESQGSSSISSSEDDYFEFISQELSPSSTSYPPEHIVFCGKLIPYKQPLDSSVRDLSKLVESKKQTDIKKKHGWSMFRWKFSLSRSSKRQVQSKSGKKSTIVMHKREDRHSASLQESPKQMYNSNKHGKGCDFAVHKMPILASSSSGKARWYVFLFGISRFSTEVELRDIKSRLSRRQSPPPPAVRLQDHNEKVSKGRNGSSGLWGLIKVLSCGGNHHPNTMVVSSISGNRLE